MQELTNKLRTTYQVMRETTSTHAIDDILTMIVQTFVRIYPTGDKDEKAVVYFTIKKDKSHTQIDSSDGKAWELLRDKYFKPEMVQY